MLTRPSFLALGLTAAAPLIHAFPSTLRFPVDSESSHGPESTLSSLNITTPLSVVGNQGPYSPYISQTSYLPRTVPEGWNVDQVSIIMRHGARFPTKNAGKRIDASLALLDNRTSIADADFAFVDGYTFSDYTADELSDFGRRECFDAGVKFKAQYADLTDNSDSFFRTAGDGRVVESSGFFLQGWNGAKFDLNATLDVPPVVISEDDGMNNTLSAATCTTDEDLDPNYGDIAHENWQSVYAPPIIARLEAALPGINLTATDLNNIMSLCGFESVRNLDYVESPWCAVFTKEEWKQHEYYYDLDKYYAHGDGSPYGKVSGIGYVNELFARLTSTDVHLGAAINSTLDTDSETFPLDKRFYVDFSHDNNMVPILTTLGLLKENDLRSEPEAGDIPAYKFIVSHTVPFAGRFVFERLAAPDGSHYVRILVNDAVVPLDITGCGPLGVKYGLCELEAFVKYRADYTMAEPSAWDEICYSPTINRTVPL